MGASVDRPQNAFLAPADHALVHLGRDGSLSKIDGSVRQVYVESHRCLLAADRALKSERLGAGVWCKQHTGVEEFRCHDPHSPCMHRLARPYRATRRMCSTPYLARSSRQTTPARPEAAYKSRI